MSVCLLASFSDLLCVLGPSVYLVNSLHPSWLLVAVYSVTGEELSSLVWMGCGSFAIKVY